MIHAAAAKHNVPAAFVKSIMAAESNFYPDAVSNKGAIGLMQLMQQTAEQFGVDPTIPAENIDGGTRYLSILMRRYQKSRDWLRRTIAAYNAGPRMVDKYRGVPPFRETRTYVARVLTFFFIFLVPFPAFFILGYWFLLQFLEALAQFGTVSTGGVAI